MSAPNDDIYDWPPDWFGSHRAYRVDRALKTVRRQLSGLLANSSPQLIFEAAVLRDDPDKTIPAHNFTVVEPYLASKCDPILQALIPKILDFLTTNEVTIEENFDPEWFSRAQSDFQGLAENKSSPELLRKCYDHVVGLVTRVPVRGYIHQVLCDHYFAQSAESRPLWYQTQVAKAGDKEIYGKITATPNGHSEPPLELKAKEQRPAEQCKFSQLGDLLMSSLLPLVSEHETEPSWPELDLIAIPVHSMHRWSQPTFGPFLGWLYVNKDLKGAKLQDVESKTLRMLWPLLDSFATELMEGEIQEFLEHYKGVRKPLDELKLTEAIPRLSGWRVAAAQSHREIAAGEVSAFEAEKLCVKLGPLESSNEIIVLERKWTTFVPQQKDAARNFGIRRFAHRLRNLYRSLYTIYDQSESVRLKKYEQMFDLLQPPLRRISAALGQMQSDTQELRAVLYEPEEALFASYTLIEPLFRGNHNITFPGANLPAIRVEHSPDHYDSKTIPLVAAKVACAIFGIDSQLDEAHDRNRVLSQAVGGLKRVMGQTAHKELAKDFTWLTKCETSWAEDGAATPRELAEILEDCCSRECTQAEKDALAKALTRIKYCLFTPFKVDTILWPQAPLQLLARHPALREATLSINRVSVAREAPPHTNPLDGATGIRFPGSFANLLTFIRDFASGAAKASPPANVIQIDYTRDGNARRFSLQFGSRLDLNVKNARKQIEAVINALKDWRVDGSNYGDITGAAVRFANRLPGIDKEWIPELGLKDDCTLISLNKVDSNVSFRVHLVISDHSLIIESNENKKANESLSLR